MKKTRRQFLKKTGLAAGIIINPFKNIYPITKKALIKLKNQIIRKTRV